MRTRAGVVLIEDNKVALIERHRAGLEYFVFPGGGVDDGETPEQGAIREAMEELGVEVAIQQKVATIHFGLNIQHYFLAARVGGKFGTGNGEEFTLNPIDAHKGEYIPIWMTFDELLQHEKVYPADLAKLVLKAQTAGWPNEPVVFIERSK